MAQAERKTKDMDAVCFTVPGKLQGKACARTFYNPKTKGMEQRDAGKDSAV